MHALQQGKEKNLWTEMSAVTGFICQRQNVGQLQRPGYTILLPTHACAEHLGISFTVHTVNQGDLNKT